jgi:biotin carboxyl carrier protein
VNGQPYQVDIEMAAVEPILAAESVTAVETAAPQMTSPATGVPGTKPFNATTKEVTAPMPGHIVEIAVSPGDEVKTGQELCSLEAMKMKNAIRAHRDGTVASVAVSIGQAVAYGDVLVTFE